MLTREDLARLTRELLDDIQWRGSGDGPICPRCHSFWDEGHEADCGVKYLIDQCSEILADCEVRE